jgi:AcrR family transcriptional regulator
VPEAEEAGMQDGRMEGMEVPETPPSDAWQRRRVEMSLRIELTALTLILDRGLDGVTVHQIARVAGISNRTFFRYFRNPRDVLTAVPVRESRRMCRALLARPEGEPLLESFHVWFGEMQARRDSPPAIAELEAEALARWGRIVATAPDAMLAESRATIALSAELEPVVRARLGFGTGDDEEVGILTAAFSAVIWYVYTRSLDDDTIELSARLDHAFGVLNRLHPSTALVGPA